MYVSYVCNHMHDNHIREVIYVLPYMCNHIRDHIPEIICMYHIRNHMLTIICMITSEKQINFIFH